MPTERSMTLGTIFTADIQNLMTGVKAVRKLLDDFSKVTSTLSQNIKKLGDASKAYNDAQSESTRELSAFAKSAAKFADESPKFRKAWAHFTDESHRQGIALGTVEKTLTKVETAIQRTGLRMNEAGKNGNLFAESANRISLTNEVLGGRLKITSDGFQRIREKITPVNTELGKGDDILTDWEKSLGRASVESSKFRKAHAELGDAYGKSGTALKTWESTLYRVEKAIQTTGFRMNEAGQHGSKFAETANRMNLVSQVLGNELKVTSDGFQRIREKVTTVNTELGKGEDVLTDWQKSVGRASEETNKFRRAQAELGEIHGKSGTALKTWESTLYRVEKAIQVTGAQLRAAGHDGDSYVKTADRVGLVNEVLEKRLRATSSGFEVIREKTKEATKELTPWEKSLQRVSGETSRFKQAHAQLGQVFGTSGVALKTWEPVLNSVEKSIQKMGFQMNQTGKTLNDGTLVGDKFIQTANRMNMASGVLNGTLKNTSTGLASVKQALNPAPVAIFDSAMGRLYDRLKSVAAYGIAATLIYGIGTAFRQTVGAIIDYDQALKNLQAITRATDTEVLAMGEVIRKVATTTKFSLTEVASAMTLIGQAGFTAGETIQATEAIVKLATGTLGDMTKVADLVTTTIRAFGLQAGDAAKVVDVMTSAVNSSKLTIEKLSVAFNYVGAAAAQAGLSLEETAASMGTLANSGLRASTIGTGLRQVLSRLIAPSSKLREEYQAQGIALDQVNPTTVGYTKALENLTKVLVNQETGLVNMAKAYQLFGLRGAQAVAVLTSSFQTGSYQKMLEKIYEVGTASVAADKQMEGLAARAKNLGDKLGNLAIEMGNAGLKGVIGDIIDGFAGFVEILTNAFENSVLRAVLQIGGMTTAFIILSKTVDLLTTSSLGSWITSNITLFTSLAAKVGYATAAFQLLWGVISNHYLIAIAAAVATVAVLFKDWNRTLEISIEKQESLIEKASATSKAFDSYVISLEKMGEKEKSGNLSLREKQSFLERMIVTYPELASRIDITTDSLADILEKMKEFNKEQEGKEIEEMIKLLNLKKEALDKNGKSIQSLAELEIEYAGWQSAINEKDKESIKLKGEIEGTLQILTARYAQQIIEKKKTIEQVEEELIVYGKLGDEIRNRLPEALKAASDKTPQHINDFVKALDVLPKEFEIVFRQLSGVEKIYFVEAVKQMQTRMASFEKTAKELVEKGIMSEAELQKGLDTIQEEALKKFQEKADKRTEKEAKESLKRLKIKEEEEKQLTQIASLALEEWFVKEKSLINNNDEAKIKLQEKHTLLKLNLELESAERILQLRKDDLENARNILDEEGNLVQQASNRKIEAENKVKETKNKIQDAILENSRKAYDREFANASKSSERLVALKQNQKEAEFKQIELNVARGYVSESEGVNKKKKLEEDFLYFVLNLRKRMLDESIKIYGIDSEQYREAAQKKMEAESNLASFKADKDIEAAKSDKKTNEESVENTKKSTSGKITAYNAFTSALNSTNKDQTENLKKELEDRQNAFKDSLEEKKKLLEDEEKAYQDHLKELAKMHEDHIKEVQSYEDDLAKQVWKTELDLIELKRESFNEFKKQKDIENEIEERTSLFKKAIADGDLKKAEEVLSRINDLYKDSYVYKTTVSEEGERKISKNEEDTLILKEKLLLSYDSLYKSLIDARIQKAKEGYEDITNKVVEEAKNQISIETNATATRMALIDELQKKIDNVDSHIIMSMDVSPALAALKYFQEAKQKALTNAIIAGAQSVLQAEMNKAYGVWSGLKGGDVWGTRQRVAQNIATIKTQFDVLMSQTGFFHKRQKGGTIPGYGGGDTVPAMLEPGEGVLTKEAMKVLGIEFLDWINGTAQKFRTGGVVLKDKIQKFREGGVVFQNKVPHFRKGGYVEGNNNEAPQASFGGVGRSGGVVINLKSEVFMGNKAEARGFAEKIYDEIKRLNNRRGITSAWQE